jgi:hypothetical protein
MLLRLATSSLLSTGAAPPCAAAGRTVLAANKRKDTHRAALISDFSLSPPGWHLGFWTSVTFFQGGRGANGQL